MKVVALNEPLSACTNNMFPALVLSVMMYDVCGVRVAKLKLKLKLYFFAFICGLLPELELLNLKTNFYSSVLVCRSPTKKAVTEN